MENRKLKVIYKSKEIEIDWTDSLNDLKDNCQRKFPYSDYEKRIAKVFIVLPNEQELEITDEMEFKNTIENEMIKTIIIKINEEGNINNNNNSYYSNNNTNYNSNNNINYFNNSNNNNNYFNNNNNNNNYFNNNNNNNNYFNNNNNNNNNPNNSNNSYFNNSNFYNNNNNNFINNENLIKRIENLEKKYKDLINDKQKYLNKINEQEKRIEKLENYILNSNNSHNNKIQDNRITKPGLIGDIIFDQKYIPEICISKFLDGEPIKLDIQVKNIGEIDITGNCKLIEENDSFFKIKNPNLNDIIGVISSGYKIPVSLELIYSKNKRINIGKNCMKIALFSSSFGIISKWKNIYIIIYEDK